MRPYIFISTSQSISRQRRISCSGVDTWMAYLSMSGGKTKNHLVLPSYKSCSQSAGGY
jgi:hypothetical protein